MLKRTELEKYKKFLQAQVAAVDTILDGMANQKKVHNQLNGLLATVAGIQDDIDAALATRSAEESKSAIVRGDFKGHAKPVEKKTVAKKSEHKFVPGVKIPKFVPNVKMTQKTRVLAALNRNAQPLLRKELIEIVHPYVSSMKLDNVLIQLLDDKKITRKKNAANLFVYSMASNSKRQS